VKIVLLVFLCLFFSFDALSQSETETKNAENPVEEVSLARDDGTGKPGETAEKFSVNDRRIYCIIQLNSEKSVAVKMNFIAAKAERLKPETKIVTVSYTTKENDNGVTFNASPNGVWAAGEYRVDIYIDNKLAKSKVFQIGKDANEASKEKLPAPKSFVPRKKINKSKND
jgi:hypothetical protein